MAVLTNQQRKKMKGSSFVFPGKRAYPIEDAAHARNALARVSQFGTPEEKAKVRSKVHSKYPSIGKDGARFNNMVGDALNRKLKGRR